MAVTAPAPLFHPHHTLADRLVLENLYHDIHRHAAAVASSPAEKSQHPPSSNIPPTDDNDARTTARLHALNDPAHPDFEPCVFARYDARDLSVRARRWLLDPYRRAAARVVRHPTDVVFLTNILWNAAVTLPSAALLLAGGGGGGSAGTRWWWWVHGVAHVLQVVWCMGPFTLMMHNHIHNGGVLRAGWAWLDRGFPYVLEPLLGHTWDSYYYHHVKHHHVESNGPDDLSSTLRYQRDDVRDFLRYEAKFMFLVWLELPMYFWRKGKPGMACRAAASEMASYAFLYAMTRRFGLAPAACVFLVPLALMRAAMMIGNWGQHALVDDVDPDDDLRSSITLIDVPSNRFSFNDGYHTAHHLNSRRHWRDQPAHFIQHKHLYARGRALVFRDIDFNMLTFRLLRKDYAALARHLVPLGPQMDMSHAQLVHMLRRKTRRLGEAEIARKFRAAPRPPHA